MWQIHVSLLHTPLPYARLSKTSRRATFGLGRPPQFDGIPITPFLSHEQTPLKRVGMSQRCQEETHAPQQIAKLFDHLVGAGEQRWWHIENQAFSRSAGGYISRYVDGLCIGRCAFRENPHIFWTIMIMLGWVFGVIMQNHRRNNCTHSYLICHMPSLFHFPAP
jgi:hypothetical protein